MRFAQLPLGCPFVFTTLLVLSVCTLGFPGLSVTSLEAATRARVDSKIIERIFGVRGQWKGDVFQVTFPRKRLGVKVSEVDFPAGMGLTSWLSFKPAGRSKVVVAGDLTLRPDEVNPAISRLLEGGIQVTALHNHLLWDEPRIMYMHFMGWGDEEDLSRTLKGALEIMQDDPLTHPSSESVGGLDTREIESIVGVSGRVKGGILKIVIPREDLKVMVDGVEMDAAMGVNSWMTFRATPQGAVVDGDYAMIASEVDPVIRALAKNDIKVLAVHNHMIGDEPRMIFLHYWGQGDASALARGLREALGELGGHAGASQEMILVPVAEAELDGSGSINPAQTGVITGRRKQV